VSQVLGLALADFGRDPLSSDSLRGSRNFAFFCLVNKAIKHDLNDLQTPVGQNTTFQQNNVDIGVTHLPCKLSDHFTIRGRF